MGLADVFKLSIYVLSGFVGLALGFAEHGLVPFISLPVTVFGYWWCEVGTQRGPFRCGGMGETPALVMGFLGLVAATIEFFGESAEGRLLAGIHLVVYLKWIFLLQPKSNYRYWLLLTLGMMHMAVGSVLTNSTWYGLCLVVYLFGAIWTLSVFSLYRVAQEFTAIDPDKPALSISDPSSTATAAVFNAVRFENDAQWISLRLVSGVSLTSTAGLLVGTAFFVLIPRVWVGTELGISDESLPPALRRKMTGQATVIRLGDMRPILESNDPVLKIRIFDNQTDRPMETQSYAERLGLREPLFRGAILPQYDKGSWLPEREWGVTSIMLEKREPVEFGVPTVRQEIRLERIGTNVLPCIGKAIAMWDPEGWRVGRMQPNAIVVRRPMFENHSGTLTYSAYTVLPSSADRNDPGMVLPPTEIKSLQSRKYFDRCREVPELLESLRVLARQLVEAEEQKVGKPLTDVQKARVIEFHLRDSGEFAYSLTAQVVDPNADPVEDFLFHRRAGHCQYFASALALMIRSVGIPAQLVTGFKGGEELSDGTLNVEKRFAHVWVEAWIENRKWMAFDATPEDGRTESVMAIGTKRNLWTTIASQLAGMWESNVLDVSYERQDNVIYQPLRDAMNWLVKLARDFWESPRTTLISIMALMADPRNWLTLPGALTLSILAALLWLLRRKTAWFRRIWRRKPIEALDNQRQRVEFYERFVRLMESHGQIREIAQTQDEFVQEVADDLFGRLLNPDLGGRLKSIGRLFYRVRFGAGELTEEEKSALDALLAYLEQELSARSDKHVQAV